MTAKISISLTDQDLAVLDAIVAEGGAAGRSEAIRVAIDHMRGAALEARLVEQFIASFDEPETQELIRDWDATMGDGL